MLYNLSTVYQYCITLTYSLDSTRINHVWHKSGSAHYSLAKFGAVLLSNGYQMEPLFPSQKTNYSHKYIIMATLDKRKINKSRILESLGIFGVLFLVWYTYGTPVCYKPTEHGSDKIAIKFDLQHIYHNVPTVNSTRIDINDESFLTLLNENGIDTHHTISARRQNVVRLRDRSPDTMESMILHSLNYPRINIEDSMMWGIDNIIAPNVTDPETILQLAKLASNAYARLPTDPSWRDVENPESNFGTGFNISYSIGWFDEGIRGHVFVESLEEGQNRTPLVIIAIKGTTAAGLGGGNGDPDNDGGRTGDDGKTVEQDKLNDNLLFSCCCARVSSLWSTVCDCYEKTYTCNQNCLEKALRHPDKYYKAALDIYRNVSTLYPNSEIWVTGHSLGGALSSMVGRTYGVPVVTFESPGEMLASKRLHLPMPPGIPEEMEHIWHFGNNADPIFMGVCNGPSSSCSLGGYAMESVCHSGMKCTYDAVHNLGWHVNILNHRLKNVIDNLLSQTNETAHCVRESGCFDCYDWTFVDHEQSKSSSSSSVSHTPTSSATSTTATKKRKCLKYTWYGSCYKWDDEDDKGSSTSAKRMALATPTDFQ